MTQPMFARDRLTWASYWMLGYFAFLQTVLGPLMPFIRHDLHLSYTVASLHFSAFALGTTVMGGVGERIAKRWRRRSAFWGGAVGMACGALLLALSPVAFGTVLAAFAMGLLGTLLLITIQAVLADRHGVWRMVALTEANVVASVCAILASAVVGIVTGLGLGWRTTLAIPLVALCALGLAYRGLPVPSQQPLAAPSSPPDSPRKLPPLYWIFACLVFFETGVEWCVAYWGAGFLVTRGQLTATAAATAMSVFFLGMVIGRYVGSRLSRHFSSLNLVIAALGVALLGFPIFWLMPPPVLRIGGLFVVGLGVATVYPLGLALATATAPDQTDHASARFAIAGGSSVLIAPVILGALADRIGIGSAFGIAVPLLLAALASALLAGRMQRGTASPAAHRPARRHPRSSRVWGRGWP